MLIDEQINRVQDWLGYPVTLMFRQEAEDEAAMLWRTVRSADPSTAPQALAVRLKLAKATLGLFHNRRHEHDRRPVDLAKAIICLSEVSDHNDMVPKELAPVVGRFTRRADQARVGSYLIVSGLESPETVLLDAGILLLTPHAADDPDVSRLLFLAHARRYEDSAMAYELDRAVGYGESVFAATGDPQVAVALGQVYHRKYILHSNVDDLKRMGRLLEDALADEDSARGPLGLAYRLLYERDGVSAHIDRAVGLSTAGGDSAGAAISLTRRFERDADPADLDRARALINDVTTLDAGTAADVLQVLLLHYQYRSDLADLERAVSHARDMLSRLPDGHRHRPGIRSALAAALHLRYLSRGIERDLEQAVQIGTWAYGARPSHDAGVALAEIHLTRYSRNGVSDDLDAASRLTSRAVSERCPVAWTAVAARVHHARHLANRAPSDLDRAVELGERAVRNTPDGHVSAPGFTADLAGYYLARGGEEDLNRAIALSADAVAATSADHIELPDRLSRSADALLARFHAKRQTADLTAAVAAATRAWDLVRVDPDHPGRARYTGGIARALLARVDCGTPVTQEMVHDLADEVLVSRSASPGDQVASQHAVGDLLLASGRPDLAVRVLDAAVALLPSLPPREADWVDRQHRVGERAGLVQAAVSAHCAVSDPAGAVRAAESGRGVLLAAEAGIRIAPTALRGADRQLADEFDWVCQRLDTPDFPAAERKSWWARYDALLPQVRAHPGFPDFLVEPAEAALRPPEGTAVLVSADRRGGQAILIRAGVDPVVISLPGLVDVESRVTALLRVFSDDSPVNRKRRNPLLTNILSWLWDALVEPVVMRLPPSDDLHRVWWVPTGILGLLPVHAAGHLGQPGALDLLVSSTIPSLRVLRTARSKTPAVERRGLAVAVHETDGQVTLENAAQEISALQGTSLVDAAATGSAVLSAMAEATWAHFVCHAVTDPASPASGGLLLRDRTVTLPEIGGLHLPEAELAYLSACSTANHGTRHADEVLHLASAFHLAGFRHVIATLWPLGNIIGPQIARAFYNGLPDGPTADAAAATLHQVVRQLRADEPGRPDRWATLIHSGP